MASIVRGRQLFDYVGRHAICLVNYVLFLWHARYSVQCSVSIFILDRLSYKWFMPRS